VENIAIFSFALAVNIACYKEDQDGEDQPACLLADRNKVFAVYGPEGKRQNLTFYPLALNERFGNFSADKPPPFLTDGLLTIMQDNLSFRNHGAAIMNAGPFQAYSNLKRSFRHGPSDLLAGQGRATAALTYPPSDAPTEAVSRKQRSYLDALQIGVQQPGEDRALKPLARERERVETALAKGEFDFRLEQIIDMKVGLMDLSNRCFEELLYPIFQLVCFYREESDSYVRILREFEPNVFPQVLGSFARLFELAIDELHGRFQVQQPHGLSVALCEGVAAIDRLAHYCFTGCKKVLVPSVMGPLGTLNSLFRAGWPYIDKNCLDLSHDGVLNIKIWPRGDDNRPILMHIPSLAFHYGPEIATTRKSLIWFRELQCESVRGVRGASAYLNDLFRDVWITEMQALVLRTVKRKGLGDDLERKAKRHEIMATWTASKGPFMWDNYRPVYDEVSQWSAIEEPIRMATRNDFAQELFASVIGKKAVGRKWSSKNSTWFASLSAVIEYTPRDRVTQEQWVTAIMSALATNSIECMPGAHRAKISCTRVVRLTQHFPTLAIMNSKPTSLKQAARAAQARLDATIHVRVSIDLGCSVPFTIVPTIITEGFKKRDDMFKSGNQGIRSHYQLALNTLQASLGELGIDVLLIIAITLASASELPMIAPKDSELTVSKKGGRHHGAWAACLITKMLWFLKPDSFGWKKDKGDVIRVSEMNKKIGKKTYRL